MRSGRPSQTALGVARGFCLAAAREDGVALAPAAELALTERLLDAAAGRWRWLRRLLRGSGVGRAALRLGELLGPGIALHLVARKRWFADETRAALDRGCRQLVVLGAGLDALAACVAEERPAVSCIEVDHPATQVLKRRALAKAGAGGPGLHLSALDLARLEVGPVLEELGAFQTGVSTVYVAEGVLMYLEEPRAAALLADLARLASGTGSVLLLSFLTGGDDGAGWVPAGGPLRWALRRVAEPFRWGVPSNALADILSASGWALQEAVGAKELRLRYPIPSAARMVDWEKMAVARLGVFL